MEIRIDEQRKIVELRQNRRERRDAELREYLRPAFRQWKTCGYFPVIVPTGCLDFLNRFRSSL